LPLISEVRCVSVNISSVIIELFYRSLSKAKCIVDVDNNADIPYLRKISHYKKRPELLQLKIQLENLIFSIFYLHSIKACDVFDNTYLVNLSVVLYS